MRAFFRILGVLGFALPCAVSVDAAQWAQTYGSGVAQSVQRAGSDGFVVAGSSDGNRTNWLLRLDATGSAIWKKTYGAGATLAIDSTADGGHVLVGQTVLSETPHAVTAVAWVRKVDTEGGVVWQKTYGDGRLDAVQSTADGGFVVAGATGLRTGGADAPCGAITDAWLMKLDRDGNVEWAKAMGGPMHDAARSVRATADGGYVVAGTTSSFGAGCVDAWVVRLDARGNIIWQRTFGGAGSDVASSVHVAGDGGYVIVGSTDSFGLGGSDAWMLKLDPNGNVVWQRTYGGGALDFVQASWPTADGGYVLAGQTNSFGVGGGDLWVFEVEADGGVVWQRTYGGNGADSAYSLQPTIDGGHVVAGSTYSFGTSLPATWVLKLDHEGVIGGCSSMGTATAASAGSAARGQASTAAVMDVPITPAIAAVFPVIVAAESMQQCRTEVGDNYQGLWWAVPAGSESGWGINFAHQADTIFATWYTYDASGEAWWLSMTANRTAEGTYSGTLLRTTGPAFNAIPFDPDKVTRTPVGTGTLTFSGTLTGQFAYTVDGIPQTKPITRQVFGPPSPCVWSAQPNLAAATNYQDLWWVANGAESGWGVNLTHQGDIIFATWFTYDFDGNVLWLSATAPKGGNGVYTGTLYRTTGPPFYAQPFDPNRVTRTPVGRLIITFADGNTGSFAYTAYGITQRKTITRQVFYPPAGTVCSTPARSPVSVTVYSPTASPWVGEQVQLTASVPDLGGYPITDQPVTWSSSDPRVATISATGTLQALATGSVVITAAVGGVSGSQALTIVPMPRISVAVGTNREVVLEATDRCEFLDGPDVPARFVRAEDGSLVLFAGKAPRYYVSRGADFNSLKRDCRQAALNSADLRTPESYENWEWLVGVYREGNRWHALITNEFHDAFAATCKPRDPSFASPCVYNSITYAVSTDGARSFSKPAPPAHVVGPPPKVWVPPPISMPSTQYNPVEGYFPNNVVKAADGYYYSLVTAAPAQNAPWGLCVMRTNSLGDPASWRAWDGSGFNLSLTSPYVTGGPAPVCAFLDTLLWAGQITYNTYLNRYVLVTMFSVNEPDGRQVCGFYYALSADLIHWSRPQLLAEARFSGWCAGATQGPTLIDPAPVAYPSIVDHDDTTTNFERAGRTPHLYYTRLDSGGGPFDLVRAPLTFTRQD